MLVSLCMKLWPLSEVLDDELFVIISRQNTSCSLARKCQFFAGNYPNFMKKNALEKKIEILLTSLLAC